MAMQNLIPCMYVYLVGQSDPIFLEFKAAMGSGRYSQCAYVTMISDQKATGLSIIPGYTECFRYPNSHCD